MSHHCPVPGCAAAGLPDSLLMCRRDWARVARPLQRAVYAAYKGGEGRGTPELARAQDAAIRAATAARETPGVV